MAMSTEHKAALVQGRREAKAIKAYLEALASRRPGRPVTRDSLQARISSIEGRLATEDDVLRRVDLIQSRLEAERALASASDSHDMDGLEKGFVEVAGEYSERKGISYGAWRAAGVPAQVLKAAGIARTRRA